jgi:hypothetical protein
MIGKSKVMDDRHTVTVRVPISIRRRGGRKLVLAPDGSQVGAMRSTRHVDSAMVKAIARAFRWRDMLESGEFATIREIATAEKISDPYLGRVLRLTLLVPAIIERIVNGRQPAGLQLDGLMRRFPVGWREQRDALSRAKPTKQERIASCRCKGTASRSSKKSRVEKSSNRE